MKLLHNTRKCLVCRQHFNKSQLLRLCWSSSNSQIIIDEDQTMYGRGYYICYDPAHISKLQKYKVLNKAFKSYIAPDNYDVVVNYLSNKLNSTI